MCSAVHVVHCVDTEGPLHESVEATFERLKAIFGIDLEPSVQRLQQLQAGDLDLGGLEEAVRTVVAPHLLAYNDTWDKVDALLNECLSPKFRARVLDSVGRQWVYNWFCVDHVDYDVNPRRRDIGYHNVFDHYRSVLGETESDRDEIHFHYHPHPFSREAHRCATHWWSSSDSLQQILCRRVIDRMWFPAANRPGFHVIRPDSHWFLEQFIPFDFSNQSSVPTEEDRVQLGVETGRWGDWRWAPTSWEPYHPSHDDYQTPGECRRWIARCLNIGTRYRLLSEADIRQAFSEAQKGLPVVLAFTDHDFRDMRPDVDAVRHLITRVAADFPGVPFKFSGALEAMRLALRLPSQEPCSLEMSLHSLNDSACTLKVSSDVPTFGPQPWLALKTVTGTYHYDNFDIDEPFHKWSYVLDEETFLPRSLDRIGVAANNAFGLTSVAVMRVDTSKVSRRHWNAPLS